MQLNDSKLSSYMLNTWPVLLLASAVQTKLAASFAGPGLPGIPESYHQHGTFGCSSDFLLIKSSLELPAMQPPQVDAHKILLAVDRSRMLRALLHAAMMWQPALRTAGS